MYLLILFFPFISAFLTGLFGRFIGRHGSVIISTSCLLFSFLIALFIFYEVSLSQSICHIKTIS